MLNTLRPSAMLDSNFVASSSIVAFALVFRGVNNATLIKNYTIPCLHAFGSCKSFIATYFWLFRFSEVEIWRCPAVKFFWGLLRWQDVLNVIQRILVQQKLVSFVC